jgi:uncharacterized protein
MAGTILVDSGPLVAVLSRRDKHHAWARSHFEALTEPLLTCEAVLSETFFLIEDIHGASERLGQLLARGVVLADFGLPDHLTRVLGLMRSYRDVPMSLADACLLCLAEEKGGSRVFTTDSDFRTYRKNNRQVIPVISP